MNQKIPYSQIAFTAPYHLKASKEKKELTLWQVLLFFGAIMVGFLFLSSLFYLLTDNSELVSLFCQLGFLAAAILFAKWMHTDLKQVFPLQKPKAISMLGCIVIIAAAYLSATVISVVTAYVAPVQLQEISEGMEATYYSGFLTVLILLNWSLMPGICEEAIHRGVILSGLKHQFQNKWVITVFAGVIFGLFHIYPVRWFAPGFLGAILAYIVLETDNMVYSCFIHFGYNAFLTILDIITSQSEAAAESVSYAVDLATVGSIMVFYGLPIPFLIYLGMWLIKRGTAPVTPKFVPAGKEREAFLKIVVPTLVLVGLGAILFLRGMLG